MPSPVALRVFPFLPKSRMKCSAHSQPNLQQRTPHPGDVIAFSQQATCNEALETGTLDSVSVQKLGTVLFGSGATILEVQVALTVDPATSLLTHQNIESICGGGSNLVPASPYAPLTCRLFRATSLPPFPLARFSPHPHPHARGFLPYPSAA